MESISVNMTEVYKLIDILNPMFVLAKSYLEPFHKAYQQLPDSQRNCLFVVTIVVVVLTYLLLNRERLLEKGKKKFFRMIKVLPFIRKKIEAEVAITSAKLEAEMCKGNKGLHFVQELPNKGHTAENIFQEVEKYKTLDHYDWAGGKVSGTVYSGDPVLTELMTKVYGICLWSNPLHPDVFASIRKMEAEVVRMCCAMFSGGVESCGAMTTGGTESIIMACKAYRDYAFDRGIKHPEMIVPKSAHAAFDKAAQLMLINIKHVPLNPETMTVDIKTMRKFITKNTCMLVGSCPQYPHGSIDPIQEIAKLGLKYNIPVHVDCCLGGFLVPFMKKAGFNLPPFDFSVEGVTSISADTHKYGFAPKGSSVILYSSKQYRKYQFFACTDWPGGIYASPSIPGSRAGGIIAACWATMMYMGEAGYVESTQKIISTAKHIEAGLREIQGIYILGKPEVCVVAFASKCFNIYNLSEALKERGWNLNSLQFPPSIHICVTLPHTKPGIADLFLEDVLQCTAKIMEDPSAQAGGLAAIYGSAQTIPDRTIISDIACCFLDACYSTRTMTEAPTPS